MEFLIIENELSKVMDYQNIGIQTIFIDLEVLGKTKRQGGLNTVITKNHSIDDIAKIKSNLSTSELLVRCNPINNNSRNEINEIIDNGADVIMLPYFKTVKEVEMFLRFVNNRVKTNILIETSQAVCRLDNILELGNIDQAHIGLNDLHLSMGLNFMFELLSSGIVDLVVDKLKKHKITYGIGGLAGIEHGVVPGGLVLAQYLRLNAKSTIISRTLINYCKGNKDKLREEILKIQFEENRIKKMNTANLSKMYTLFEKKVQSIVL